MLYPRYAKLSTKSCEINNAKQGLQKYLYSKLKGINVGIFNDIQVSVQQCQVQSSICCSHSDYYSI